MPSGVGDGRISTDTDIMNDPNSNTMNTMNHEEHMENEPAVILSPELNDAFPLFASMLDIKSFMKLAMASAKMYTLCMEDRRIRISIEEDELEVDGAGRTPEFRFHPSNVQFSQKERYLQTVNRLNCNVNLKKITFIVGTRLTSRVVTATRNYLSSIRVNSVDTVHVDGSGWPEDAIDFIKDFHIKNVTLREEAPPEFLSSLLPLNLDSLFCGGDFPVDLLLRIDSPIRKIEIVGLQEKITDDDFIQILWKIQCGTLRNLVFLSRNIDWSPFDLHDFWLDEVNPEDRPFVFFHERRRKREYFVLHWHGGVTKCLVEHIEGRNFLPLEISITKCDPSEYPPALKTKEQVFKELSQKSPRVLCLSSMFKSYFDSVGSLYLSNDGHMPKERPLLCQDSDTRFLTIGEGGKVDEYTWSDGYANLKVFDMQEKWPKWCKNPVLARFFFQNMIQAKCDQHLKCDAFSEYQSLIRGHKVVPFDYNGPLPETRPLLFEYMSNDSPEGQAVTILSLLEDNHVTESHLHSDHFVMNASCPPWRIPPVLVTVDVLKGILLMEDFSAISTLSDLSRGIYCTRVDLAVFLATFNALKTLPFDHEGSLPEDRPLVFEKRKGSGDDMFEQRWVFHKQTVRLCVWQKGQAIFCTNSFKDYPKSLKRELFGRYIQGKGSDEFLLDYYSLCGLLEEYKMLPYNFSGRLPDERPLIFEKREIKHCCAAPSNSCGCDGVFLRYWSLSKDELLTNFSWSEEEQEEVFFSHDLDEKQVPMALRSSQFFTTLLQRSWKPDESIKWYGYEMTFAGYSRDKGYMAMKHTRQGPLPKQRPLVFSCQKNRWFLREDGVVLHCKFKLNHVEIHVSEGDDLPPALVSMT